MEPTVSHFLPTRKTRRRALPRAARLACARCSLFKCAPRHSETRAENAPRRAAAAPPLKNYGTIRVLYATLRAPWGALAPAWCTPHALYIVIYNTCGTPPRKPLFPRSPDGALACARCAFLCETALSPRRRAHFAIQVVSLRFKSFQNGALASARCTLFKLRSRLRAVLVFKQWRSRLSAVHLRPRPDASGLLETALSPARGAHSYIKRRSRLDGVLILASSRHRIRLTRRSRLRAVHILI